MKKIYMTMLAAAALCTPPMSLFAETEVPSTEGKEVLKIYDEVIFFDGYNTLEGISDESKAMIPEDDGILRHRTSLYSIRLTDEQLSRIGKELTMLVEIGALCDNYDRIGNINLAFVPKGAETYNPDEVQRIEIGRFITPFMNKNYEPSTVPYVFEADYLSLILRDSKLRADHDICAEFELFGIPYAANTQVKGCADRQDVFTGTLTFITNPEPAPAVDNDVIVPVVIKKPEYIGKNFNNYSEEATDELGKTIKTWTFEVPEDVTDAQIVFITSNHGANTLGEEYKRRNHFVYYDEELMMTYKPGRTSCEPFRMYNTQGNGIYGTNEMTDKAWQSFSNWCPGDKIDNRILHLGEVKAGTHAFKISVPDAKFIGSQGDFPVSIFFQGVTSGTIAGEAAVNAVKPDFRSSIKVEADKVTVTSDTPVQEILLYDVAANLLAIEFDSNVLSLSDAPRGVLVLMVEYADGLTENYKIIR